MPPKSKPLTAQQRAVLEWIQDGCPSGVYESGYDHRIVARGLERRGLVRISGRGSTWNATMRPAGEEVLKEPAPEVPPEPDLTAADELVQRVLDAGGELELTEADKRDEVRKLIEQSMKSPLRPHGKQLKVVGDFFNAYAVVLVDYFSELVEPKPVRILERIGKYHPSVKRFKQNRDIQRVSEDHIPRATLILQSLVQAAEKHGVKVPSFDEARRLNPTNSNRKLSGAHLIFQVDKELYAVNIRELPLKGGKKFEDRWELRGTRPQWILDRGYEFIPSGKLELIVDGIRYGESRYRDSKRKTLEDQLPQVFRGFEITRRYAAVAKELESKKAAYEKRRRDKEAEVARGKYLEAKRWEHFKELSERWRRLENHREFLHKAKIAAQALDSESQGEVSALLERAAETIDKLDPLKHPEQLRPKIKDPTHTDLQPYMPNRARFW